MGTACLSKEQTLRSRAAKPRFRVPLVYSKKRARGDLNQGCFGPPTPGVESEALSNEDRP
jgi:hypothetical protein